MNKSEGGQHLREDKHVWKHRPNKVCICICKYMLIVCVSFVISIYYIHIMISIRMFKYTYLTWIQHNDIPLSFFSSKMSTSLGKIHNPSQSSVWSLAATFLRKKQSQQNPPKGLSWFTLQEINISHLGKRKIIFKYAISGGYVNSLEGIMVYLFQFKKSQWTLKALRRSYILHVCFFWGERNGMVIFTWQQCLMNPRLRSTQKGEWMSDFILWKTKKDNIYSEMRENCQVSVIIFSSSFDRWVLSFRDSMYLSNTNGACHGSKTGVFICKWCVSEDM